MNPKRYASEEFVQKYVDEHGGSGGRADWAQNDPDGAGYIENRPFYEEVTNTEILNATLNYDGYEGGYYHSFLTEGASPKSGASYTITINNDHEEIYTLGDDYTSTWYTYTDSTTGKIYNLFFGELWVGGIVITAEDGSTDPLSVVVNGTVNTIVSIEDKYLPQWVIETRTQASQAYSTANSKMNKTNPEGTGTLSVNRKSGTTTGKKSAAIGNSTTASGANSFAAGNSTTASGNSATAFGTITTASGANAIAGGMEAVASGANSFAIGATVEAQGYATFVSGSHSQALKDGSFAIGMGTVANAPYQHVQGRANLIDENNEYAHIVGNGTYTADGSKRANAHTLDWDGVPWYQGRPQFGGNAQDDGALQVLAEGEAVPVPPIAEVGQTMIITAVDEDGRPTEWEPIDVLMYDRENPPAGVENGVYVGPDSPQNVNPVAKTPDMTQPVGVDENGRLWTAPTSGENSGGGESGGTEIADTEIPLTFYGCSYAGATGEVTVTTTQTSNVKMSHENAIDGREKNIKFKFSTPAEGVNGNNTVYYRIFAYDADGTFVGNWNIDGTMDTNDTKRTATLDGSEYIIPAGYMIRFVFQNSTGSMFTSNALMGEWVNTLFKVYYTEEVTVTPDTASVEDSSVMMLSFNRAYVDTGEYTEDLQPKWDGTFSIHRGWPTAPNNTLQAIWEAKKNGYTMCELDVRLTSDNKAVLCHDATVTGTVGGESVTYTIAETPLATLQTVCVGNTAFPNAMVCSLEDAMRLCRRIGMRPEIDYKVSGTDNSLYSDCVAMACKYGLQDDTLHCCYSIAAAVLVKTAYPKANLRVDGASLDSDDTLDVYLDKPGNMYAYYSAGSCGKTDGSNVGENVSNETRILANKAKGYKTYIWNVTPNLLPDVMQWEPDILQLQSGRETAGFFDLIRNLNAFDGMVW